MVCVIFCLAHQGAATRLAGHRERRLDADLRAHRQRENAHGVSMGAQWLDVPAAPAERAALPRVVPLAAQGTGRRRRAQSARAAGRHLEFRAIARRRVHGPGDRHPHRRHAAVGAREIRARSGRHPHHHAGIALSDDDLERARRAARHRDRDHRRDPRAGAEQTGRAHGGVAGTPDDALRETAATHRTVGDAEAVGGGCAFLGRGDQQPLIRPSGTCSPHEGRRQLRGG
jgi:hypothetical protein